MRLNMPAKEYRFTHVIIGGGIVGLYAATRLVEAGENVLLIEKGGKHLSLKLQGTLSESSSSDFSHFEDVLGAVQPNAWFGDRLFLRILRYSRFGGSASYWGGEHLLLTEKEFHDANLDVVLEYETYKTRFCEYVFPFLTGQTMKQKKFDELAKHNWFITSRPKAHLKCLKQSVKSLAKDHRLTILENTTLLDISDQNNVIKGSLVDKNGDFLGHILSQNIYLCMGGIETTRFLCHSASEKNSQIGERYSEVLHGQVGTCCVIAKQDEKAIEVGLTRECWRGAVKVGGVSYSYLASFQANNRWLTLLLRNIFRSVLFGSSMLDALKILKYLTPSAEKNRNVLWICVQGPPDDCGKVGLGRDRDRFGMKKPRIVFNPSTDYTALVDEIVKNLCKNNKIKEFRGYDQIFGVERPKMGFLYGGAHMTGGTPLGREGLQVVDNNLSLVGMEQIKVFSSSILARAPAANLTATVLALVDHVLSKSTEKNDADPGVRRKR